MAAYPLKDKAMINDKLLDIVNKLHSTLEIDLIIQYFAGFLKKHLKFDSIAYINNKTHTHFYQGIDKTYQFNYNLTIDNQPLGKITLTRAKRFSKNEVFKLEEYLCLLISPLKNATTHYQALYQALHDPLTQLLNRGSLESTLTREMKLADRYNKPLSLLILDIDNFKMINDYYGHLVGDEVLSLSATIIKQTIRETDVAFRIGGEEFLVILSDTDKKGAKRLAERLRDKVQHAGINVNKKTLNFTVSLGLSCYITPDSQHTLISRADKAMYQAKSQGKNQVCVV